MILDARFWILDIEKDGSRILSPQGGTYASLQPASSIQHRASSIEHPASTLIVLCAEVLDCLLRTGSTVPQLF